MDWRPVAWAETEDIICANAPMPQENSFAPLEKHITQWYRALKARTGRYGACVCASPATLTARLEAHLRQPGACALAGLHPEGRMAGWWLGFCRGGRAETVYSDGDDCFYARLPGAVRRLGAESLRLLKPPGSRDDNREPALHGRILNVEKILRALPAETAESAIISVEDLIFPKNHACWQVEAGVSEVTCVPRANPAGGLPALLTSGEMAAFLFGDTMAARGNCENCVKFAKIFPPTTAFMW